jgi:hypothetical protein
MDGSCPWAIFHTVDDEGLVYRVFEVLNSRGLDVASIDKLKSQLMGLVFEHGADAGRDEAVKELHRIWQDIYRTIGKQKFTTETMRFAATLKAPADASHRRPLDEQRSLETLVSLAGTKPKKIIDCAKWLQAVVNAEDKLLANHRWRAVTRILQARLTAAKVLLRGCAFNSRRHPQFRHAGSGEVTASRVAPSPALALLSSSREQACNGRQRKGPLF